MSLRETAALDLRAIVEDPAGFGWPITVTNPDGAAAEVVGLSTDVGLTIDPQTGIPISGRRASVAITMRSLEEHGLEVPRGVADSSRKPWRITFADIQGKSREYKVADAMPDYAIGNVVCILEIYKP